MIPRRAAKAWIIQIICALLALSGGVVRGEDASKLTVYDTRYYIMHTDLPLPMAKEAAIRMTRMAEEYHNRTKAFSGNINHKLPFFLFRQEADYLIAGGMPGSVGVFRGDDLMAIAGDVPTAETWHTIQHEGFHQFVFAVIGGDMPTWMNEGLAEYFGYSVFTGDSFVSGVVEPLHLRMIKARMSLPPSQGGFRPANELMLMSHQQWNAELSGANYDQAWSMVQFLAHGDKGKYQQAFASMMIELGHGKPWDISWRDNFGSVAGFEERWRAYWTKLSNNPTDILYAKATVSTLSSFLARCSAQNQSFADMKEFLNAAIDDKLEISDEDWLPRSLILNAAANVKRRQALGAKFSIVGSGATNGAVPINPKPGEVTCTLRDGTKLVASATYAQDGKVSQVTVDITDPQGKLIDASK
ncbi:MAG: DUF1570 domain-containing protein [Planctomycetota bacterium]|nr:DUF1570 domain-containing protein [Planctomycetota bacterium]